MGTEDDLQYAAWLHPVMAVVLAGCVYAWIVVVRRIQRGRPLLRRRRRRPVPWGADGAVLAVLALTTAALSLLLHDAIEDQPIRVTLVDAAYYAGFAGVLSLVVAAWLAMTSGATPADFGWPSTGSRKTTSFQQFGRDVGVGVVAWLAVLPLVYLVQWVVVKLLGQPSGHPTIEQLLSDPSGQGIAAAVLMAVVVAPLYEEFAFRVLLQGWLERVAGSRRAWWPIVIASAAFAASHTGQGFAPVPLFVLSLGFGYVYRQTHRFAPCAAMHAAFNALSLLVAVGIETAN